MPLSQFKPDAYDRLLADKVATVEQLLAPFSPPPPQVYASARSGYRMRAEFRVWHQGDELDYVMYRREDPRTPIPLTRFPVANERIQALMPDLMDRLKPEQILRRKLFQVEFLSTLSGDTLVSLVYHRRLDDEWEQAAIALAQELGVSIVGRSRKQKLVVGRDYVVERFSVQGTDYSYRQYEQAFTQPNGELNIRMIEWACAQAEGLGGDLLELYCGNGNFTLPLSRHFDQVIATELSKASIKAARENILANAIRNIEMIRLSAEEVTQAMNGERPFRRLAHLPRTLVDYKLDTLFVDPPRAGIDLDTARMASRFPNILYISCNPQTLAANLGQLRDTHDISRFAVFDQVPYTDHLECGVLLTARDAAKSSTH
jgi:tRNA (uracil-5-)-methyltransferase